MSLSSSEQDNATRTLKQWLENDKRVVTYRDVSREVGCHVNLAKNLLLSYYATHTATATYLLTGPLLRNSTLAYTQLPPTAPASPTTATQSLAHLGGQVKIVDMDQMSDDERNSEVDDAEDDVRMTNDDGALDQGALGIEREGDGDLQSEEVPRWGVVMVSEEGLEEKKQLFEQDKLSIHIYALSPSPVKDPGQYLVSNLSLRTKENYHNSAVYGTISGEGFKAAPEAMRDGGIDFGAKKTATKKVEPAPAPSKKKADPIPAKKDEPKKKEATNGQPEKAVKPEAVEDKPAAKKTAEKRRSKSPEKAEPKASGSKKAATSKPGPTSSQTRHDEQAAMEAMMGIDMDQDFTMDDSDLAEEQDAPSKSAASVTVKAEPGTISGERKRKRRIVKKSKMEMDDKGYMVTKDYDTEESYSGESDTEPAKSTGKAKPAAKSQPAKVKTAPPTAPSRTGSSTSIDSDRKPNISKAAPSGGLKKGAGGQTSLQGFFKKK